MNRYELAVLLHPDLEIDLEAPLARLDELLAGVKAKVSRRDDWGKRKLAYPINNQSFAVYVFYRLELDPAKVADLERGLRLNEEVIRFLVVSLEGIKEEDVQESDEDKVEAKNAKEVSNG